MFPSVLLYTGIFPIVALSLINLHCGSSERKVRVETVSLQFHCTATGHSVGRTSPSAAGVLPAFQSFAESTPVPEAWLQ